MGDEKEKNVREGAIDLLGQPVHRRRAGMSWADAVYLQTCLQTGSLRITVSQ